MLSLYAQALPSHADFRHKHNSRSCIKQVFKCEKTQINTVAHWYGEQTSLTAQCVQLQSLHRLEETYEDSHYCNL